MAKFDDLNETFNIEEEAPIVEIDASSEIVEEPKKEKPVKKDDVTNDYEYTRGNLYSIIEKGQEAINGILELAQETETPRAYEVVGHLIKNVSDATDKLLDLQKKMHELDQDTKKQAPTTVNNALFVGSTAELSKLLNKKAFDNIQNETLNK
tara:strand:+ start:20789 stop:21244 length:456 start_codon:yes stop_codon:yes gene_type:complete